MYRGLGAWVDLYDYVLRDKMDPLIAVEEMADRKVKTLYLQTGRWNLEPDIVDPATVAVFIDAAHARGIRVVGWYLPGFGDLGRDLRRSLAVLEFVTPSGGHFDGFAPDIEDRREVEGDISRFNDGIARYSRALRGAVGEATTIAAIVPDAKNNKRLPQRWLGFPWEEIAEQYDVIMPMAYWSVTKGANCSAEYDAAAYMQEVEATTQGLMGETRPMHSIGGIADCISAKEVAGYVSTARELHWVGVSLYDFATTRSNPAREALWEELHRFRDQ